MSTRGWPLTSNDVIYWIWIAMELLCTAPYPAVVQVITEHKHKSTYITYIHTVNGHGWALHTTHLLEIPPHTTITHSVLIYCNCPDYKAAIKYSADELHYNNSENMLILVAKINYSLERKSKCSYVHYVFCCEQQSVEESSLKKIQTITEAFNIILVIERRVKTCSRT